MLYGILLGFYVFACLILALLVMIQKSKSSLGLGNIGGATQTLFGGSGGQDLFQKITWALGAVFMLGALVLGYMKSNQVSESKYIANIKPIVAQEAPVVPGDLDTESLPAEQSQAE